MLPLAAWLAVSAAVCYLFSCTCCSLLLAALAAYLWYTTPRFDWNSLSGKRVLLTGASSGIGEEMAYKYCQHGANIVIVARRENKLKEVQQKCRDLSGGRSQVEYVVGDMSDLKTLKGIIETAVSRLGGLDHLILNHALMPLGSAFDGKSYDLDEHDRTITTNYVSFVHLAYFAMPELERAGGSIAIISSITGRVPVPFGQSYSASKFALDGFFTSLRMECDHRKVPVSVTFCTLGRIDTPGANPTVESWFSLLGVSKVDMDSYMPTAPADECAAAIVAATALRTREIYYDNKIMKALAVLPKLSIDLFTAHYDKVVFGQWQRLIGRP